MHGLILIFRYSNLKKCIVNFTSIVPVILELISIIFLVYIGCKIYFTIYLIIHLNYNLEINDGMRKTINMIFY